MLGNLSKYYFLFRQAWSLFDSSNEDNRFQALTIWRLIIVKATYLYSFLTDSYFFSKNTVETMLDIITMTFCNDLQSCQRLNLYEFQISTTVTGHTTTMLKMNWLNAYIWIVLGNPYCCKKTDNSKYFFLLHHCFYWNTLSKLAQNHSLTVCHQRLKTRKLT